MADEYRELIALNALRQEIHSKMREAEVVRYYATRRHGVAFYRVISTDDPETRAAFGIPARDPAADIVVEVSANRAIIAEVKGSDLEKALEQLRNTARYVRQRYVMIEPKIFLNRPAPMSASEFIYGLYRALRICNSAYPAEWMLMEPTEQGDTGRPVEIDGMYVNVIFGPLMPLP